MGDILWCSDYVSPLSVLPITWISVRLVQIVTGNQHRGIMLMVQCATKRVSWVYSRRIKKDIPVDTFSPDRIILTIFINEYTLLQHYILLKQVQKHMPSWLWSSALTLDNKEQSIQSILTYFSILDSNHIIHSIALAHKCTQIYCTSWFTTKHLFASFLRWNSTELSAQLDRKQTQNVNYMLFKYK